MGAQSHVQGVGASIGLLGRRSLPAYTEALAQKNTSIRYAIYNRSLGNAQHEVHDRCNSTPYTVGAIARDLTFSRGQVVTLGADRGGPGDVIVGVAPPNLAGADTTVVNLSVVGAPYHLPRVSVCPLPLGGKTYLALGSIGSSSGTGFASVYFDGAHGERLADLAWTVQPLVSSAQRIHPRGDVVLCGGGDGVSVILWDIRAGTATALTLTGVPDDLLGGPVWVGGSDDGAYAMTAEVFGDRHLAAQMYRFPLGVGGIHALADYAMGPPFSSPGPYSTAAEVGMAGPYRLGLVPTGPTIEMVAERHDLGRNVLLSYRLATRSWSVDVSRGAPFSALGGDGRPISSNRGLVSQGLQLSVVPAAPASPPFDLLPPDWTLNGPPLFSVSPSLSHAALYPFFPGADSHMLLRMAIQPLTIPEGCAKPAITVEPAPWGFAWDLGDPAGAKPTVMLARD